MQLLEARGHVATGAQPAESTSVCVVEAMARITSRALLDVLSGGMCVACSAGQTFVRAVKGEVGIGLMIEDPSIPSIGVVATRAITAKRTAVGFVFLMTLGAASASAAVHRAHVTGFTRRQCMQPL